MSPENREVSFADTLIVDTFSTGREFHLLVTKGFSPEEGGSLPRIIGARYEATRGTVVLEFDRPVPVQLYFQNVPPL